MNTKNNTKIIKEEVTKSFTSNSKKEQILKYYQDNFNLDLKRFSNTELNQIIPIINNKIEEKYNEELQNYTNYFITLDNAKAQLQALLSDYYNV